VNGRRGIGQGQHSEMCAASGVDLSRDALVGIDFDQAAQSRYLPRGELFGYPVLRRGGRRLAALARFDLVRFVCLGFERE